MLVAEHVPALAFLRYSDSFSAIVVALICLHVIYRLGHRTIDALVDRAPEGLSEKVAAAAQAVPGVLDCHDVRLRTSGPQLFVDVHVLVDGEKTVEWAHNLTEVVDGFTVAKKLNKYAIYVFDYGAPVGWRLLVLPRM